jgi:hypothetical protein
VHDAYDVVEQIVQLNSNIGALNLVTYIEGPNWRGQADEDRSAGIATRLNGIEQDRGERIAIKLSRREISSESLRGLAHRLHNKLLGIVSKVELVGGRLAHIPMMDFMCAPSPDNLETVSHLLSRLHQGRGWLLESGRSYHYYGCRLLTDPEWRVFLGKCLLMSGFTDDRYIGHQLVDGHCVLRLSSRKASSVSPMIVAEFS